MSTKETKRMLTPEMNFHHINLFQKPSTNQKGTSNGDEAAATDLMGDIWFTKALIGALTLAGEA
jgi:hypothetical protein